MDNTNSDSLSADSSWDRYWRGMKEGGQFGVGGASHPRLNQFWREYFSSMGTLSAPTLAAATAPLWQQPQTRWAMSVCS
jgi:hypothetical protein